MSMGLDGPRRNETATAEDCGSEHDENKYNRTLDDDLRFYSPLDTFGTPQTN